MSSAVTARLTAPLLRSALTPATRRAGFSTAQTVRNANPNPTPNQNPLYPAFSFKHITSNPRTRKWLIAAFVGLACVETAGWIKFAPKVWGKKDGGEEGSSA